jgi:glycosyltransferase involved in cell wall biosynthesis
MKLSVIIPVYQSHEIVRRQILHWRKIGLLDAAEVIVVDDHSDPPLDGNDVTIYRTNNALAWTQGLARNLGAEKAQGEYLFMTDIDHIISRESLEDALAFDGNKMIFRRQIAILDKNGDLRQDRETLSAWGYEREGLDASVHGNTFVMHKSVFLELGGYDAGRCSVGYHPVTRQGDDCYLNAKWNRRFRSQEPALGRDIYLFPTGRFHKNGNLSPHGLFHGLSHKPIYHHKGERVG